jgi:hypothetical protein
MSHVTARLEIRSLVASLKLPAEDHPAAEKPEDSDKAENGGKKNAAAA